MKEQQMMEAISDVILKSIDKAKRMMEQDIHLFKGDSFIGGMSKEGVMYFAVVKTKEAKSIHKHIAKTQTFEILDKKSSSKSLFLISKYAETNYEKLVLDEEAIIGNAMMVVGKSNMRHYFGNSNVYSLNSDGETTLLQERE